MKELKWLVRSLLILTIVFLPAAASATEVARVDVDAAIVEWSPVVEHERLVLTVSRPDESTARQELAAGQNPVYQLTAGDPDGVYTWELRASPKVGADVKKELAAARKSGDPTILWRLRKEGKLPEELVQSGTFTVSRGAIVPSDQTEKAAAAGKPTVKKGQPGQDMGVIFEADQVIPDDLIVQGSGCFGFDCVNNESFGFDTIRLKENNTRIKFEDTSVGTFPTNDWQLTANDSASGGASKFSIEDITGAKVPFTVTAGASTNSIFVDSTGRVGFRTSTPVLDLHVNTSNTPALRLEQNNSGGFTAQTWDIGANEANFFVRDVTGGSRLSFRIRPGAPTSSLDISADGDVGVGTASPSAKLHVQSSGAGSTDGKVLIENTNTTVVSREALELQNDGGPVVMIFKDSTAAARWVNGTSGENFLMNNQANGGVEFTLTGTGSLTIAGTLTQGSSRDIKTGFVTLDAKDILSRVSGLPVSQWSYKTENGVRHFGPMAEDFHQAFGLGEDEKHIAPGDAAGIALAAVQGLNQVVQEKDKEIGDLQQRNADLEKRLADLEALVASLAKQK
jgi:hypothetical protein